jgi:hypothetical protein
MEEPEERAPARLVIVVVPDDLLVSNLLSVEHNDSEVPARMSLLEITGSGVCNVRESQNHVLSPNIRW